MKATAIAPSNIAFIKYWGKKDETLRIPENGSISMNLNNLLTTTTVEFNPELRKDNITLKSKSPRRWPKDSFDVDNSEANDLDRIIKHLDRVRSLAKINVYAKVVSVNNFPSSTGLSSSASGFAALTLAASKAAGLNLSEKELSILARLGSGSACRSIPDGFVEWLDGNISETSYGISIYPHSYWDIADVVALVSKDRKEISTTEGQKLAASSPFFSLRLEKIKEKIKFIKKYLKDKDFKNFGELLEAETLELHTVMLTSKPSLIYWLPETLKVMHTVKRWRQEGLEVYFTINTGQDIHLICQKKDTELVSKKASKIPEVENVVVNYPSIGAHIVSKHLF